MPCPVSHLQSSGSLPQMATSQSTVRHVGGIGHVKFCFSAGGGNAFLERNQQPVFARGTVDRHFFGEDGDGQRRLTAVLWRPELSP